MTIKTNNHTNTFQKGEKKGHPAQNINTLIFYKKTQTHTTHNITRTTTQQRIQTRKSKQNTTHIKARKKTQKKHTTRNNTPHISYTITKHTRQIPVLILY